VGCRDREERDADRDEEQRERRHNTAIEAHATVSLIAVTITRQGAFLST
jgi:hypothetical protein